METINIKIKDGNVSIESDCSHESLFNALTVFTASVAMNSSDTLDELVETIKINALSIIENSYLTVIKKEGEPNDI